VTKGQKIGYAEAGPTPGGPNRCPPFHVWPTGYCIHSTLYFKNVAPLLFFGPSFWFLAPPAAKSWRRACAEAIQTELCNVNLTTTCLCVSLAKARTTQKARRAKMTKMNLPWAAIYLIFGSLKEILERQLILYLKMGCCNIFCNCESSRVSNALCRPAAVEAVACRGLMRPGATVGWYGFFKILVSKHWRMAAIVTEYILLWRHKMTSYSRMQTNVFVKFDDTTRRLSCTDCPYSLLYKASL